VIGGIVLIVIAAFTIFLLVKAARTPTNPEQSNEPNMSYGRRMFFGGAIGFALGLGTALLLNPPFKGMWNTSSDVQGLVLFSWIVGGGIGAILLLFASLISVRRKQKQP
jgi:hypothetical protein